MSVNPGTPPQAPNGAATPPPAAESSGDGEAELLAKSQAILNGDEETPAESNEETPASPEKKEAPKEEKKEPEPDQAELSAGFARLRAEQKRFEKRKQDGHAEYLAREEKLKAESAAFEKSKQEWEEKVKGASSSPLKALKALGWEYTDLMKYVADGNIPMEKIREDFQIQLSEHQKKLLAEHEASKKEIEQLRQERERERLQRDASAFEERLFAEADELIKAEPEKFRNLARVPREHRNKALIDQMLQHYTEHKVPLALSDAMLYQERGASTYASWFAREAASPGGSVQSENPGAAKPETEPRPISQRDASVRGVQKKNLDDLTDEEREELSLRILAGDTDEML